jgi:hypothetical protein
MKLRDDGRAQSIQVGAVLLFGALIVLFATYQAFIVPGQNQQVEFNHNQRVEGDMLELRNAVLGVAQVPGRAELATVELGTRFPPRLVALNPPPPSGTLRTTDPRPVLVENASGGDVTGEVCPGGITQTQAIEYTPSYSEYEVAGTIRYENTLLYHDFREGNVTLSGQRIVSGDRVLLAPVNGSLLRSTSRTTSVEPTAVRSRTTRVRDPTVTVPTALSNNTWVELLDGEVDPSNVNVSGGNLTLTLSGTYTVRCTPAGVGESSVSEQTVPAEAGDVKLTNEIPNGDNVTAEFINTAGTTNLTEVRLNYYRPARNNNDPPGNVSVIASGAASARVDINGPNETLDPRVTLQGNNAVTSVVFQFENGTVNPDDWFAVTFEFETGERRLFIVAPEDPTE